MNADDSDMRLFYGSPAMEYFPRWSPDGTKIAFQTSRDGNSEVYVVNPDGSQQTNLTNYPGPDGTPFWSPCKTSRPEGMFFGAPAWGMIP